MSRCADVSVQLAAACRRAPSGGLVALLLATAVGCAPRARAVRPAFQQGGLSAETPSPSEPSSDGVAKVGGPPAAVDALPPEADAPVAEPPMVRVPRALPQLDPFYERLDAVLNGRTDRSVRVLWLGDSHTAADFLTHEVRKHLQATVRPGGPGFVRLGLDGYRHSQVRFSLSGRFNKAPILPAQSTRVLDGVFGYGGIRTLPIAGAKAEATLREPDAAEVVWTLSYRLPKGAQLMVRLGDQSHRLRPESRQDPQEPGAGVTWAAFTGSANETFSVQHVSGDPEIFGAFVDTVDEGVVLDTVGINGARVATPLAWEPDQFREQIRRRGVDLLVVAFGTNEAFDRARTSHYREQTMALVKLAREARPELPCWVVGPPDAANSRGGSLDRVVEITAAQAAAAKELGCAFSSQLELMGGEGSFASWMSARPSKARSDRVHLTISGYKELGELLANELLPVDVDDTGRPPWRTTEQGAEMVRPAPP